MEADLVAEPKSTNLAVVSLAPSATDAALTEPAAGMVYEVELRPNSVPTVAQPSDRATRRNVARGKCPRGPAG